MHDKFLKQINDEINRIEKNPRPLLEFPFFKDQNVTSLSSKFNFLADPFFKHLIYMLYQKKIRDLKLKTRIPVEKGALLMGIADKNPQLKYGEVFVSVMKNGKFQVIEGDVIVVKNPALHPGDIRKLKAVNIPGYDKIYRECIVFPIQGKRPHTTETSGGDLGFKLCLFWKKLINIFKNKMGIYILHVGIQI